MSIVYNILLLIDGAIYNLIDYVYDIFDFLAGINIFDQSDYNEIVDRIYVILGLFMLFVLAYSLLRAVISPDDFAKGEASFPNLIKNVIISLVIIVLLPTVFSVAYNIQNVILNNETIPRLILGDNYEINEETYNTSAGKTMALGVFNAFFYPNAIICTDGASDQLTDEQLNACKENIMSSNFTWYLPSTWGDEEHSLADIENYVLDGASFTNFTQFSDAVAENQISYTPLVSTLAGGFLLYVLLNFCFDLAVRVVKLAFYQIIAPIPVICRVIPGGKMKDVFSKWVRQVISIFLEVFIRIAIMYLGVFIIVTIKDNFSSLNFGDLSFAQKNITYALLIMGVIIFIRQAPKLLGELLNLDTGGMKLGLMDKLAMGGAFAIGGAAGGLATTGIRNAVSGGRNVWNNAKKIPQSVKNAQGVRAKTKAILGGAGGVVGSLVGGALSTVAGAGSGLVRAGYAGLGAKNIKDMKGAVNKGAAGAAAAKTKRDSYKASHGNIFKVGAGHVSDAVRSAGDYFGFSEGFEVLNKEKATADEMMGFYKTMAGYVEDNEMVANYAGLYEAEKKKEISSTVFDSQKYQEAVNARVAMYKNDSRYSSMDNNDLYSLASSEVDRNQFTRERTAKELGDAIAARQERLKMYDNLKKMATIKAINEKLNDKTGDVINDGRFQAVVNQAEVFKKQNSTYDFVQNMQSIAGVQWDDSWNDIMNSGDAEKINNLMKEFKGTNGPSPISFFGDSEIAKNKSGAVSAEIAKKIQEKKEKDSK